MTSYFLFAGEASADLHGSRLIQALRNGQASTYFCGVGGPLMRQTGLDCLIETECFQVMGLTDVLKSLPHLWKQFYQVKNYILKINPDCIILIDYPGFNLRLAQSLRKSGFKNKIVQYICPTVWAHGKKRIEVLATCYDLLLTIYPFEEAFFAHTSLKVEYVGNPLIETIQAHPYQLNWKQQIGLPEDKAFIALFPGSRPGEINLHVPKQLEAAIQLKKRFPYLNFAISCAQESLHTSIRHLLQNSLRLDEELFIVPPHFRYELMKSCQAALAKSGTVTLELALHQVPTVVHYELSAVNYLFAKYVLRLQLPFYCIVNILGNQMIYPELIGKKLSSIKLHQCLENVIFNSTDRLKIMKECELIKLQLGNRSSHQYAARAIGELLKC